MLSRISRLPLRRCLHTGAQTANSASSFGRTAKFIVGVSTFSATAYLTWRLRESRHIALDSPSSNLPPNSEIPHSSKNSDSGTISGDAKKGDNIDGEGADGEDADGEGADGEGSSEGAAASGGAFNPETGEINWDCPCLGGMAHGPCGPEFREAFSCFVYSEAEPKGINCVEKFQNMQNCFRAHPEIYADEIANDDDEEQAPQPESSNTDKVDDDATTELNSPSKPPIEGEVSPQNEV